MTVINRKDREKMEDFWEIKCEFAIEENKQVINGFLLNLKNCNKSNSTINSHRKALQFFFKDRGCLYTSLTVDDIQEWVLDHQNEWKASTLFNKIYTLRKFYCFCVEKGYLFTSPVEEYEMRKVSIKNYWEVELPNNANQKVINEFLLSLKMRNRTKSTINNYRYTLESFFYNRNSLYSSITSDIIQQWLMEHKKEWSEKRFENHYNVLCNFYLFCVKKGYMVKPPLQFKGKINENTERYWEVKTSMTNEENQKVVNEFLLSMKVKNKCRNSIIRYRCFLQILFKEKEELFSSLTSEDIQTWIIENEGKWAKYHRQDHLNILNAFYQFCVEKGYKKESPIQRKSIETYCEIRTPISNSENQKVMYEFLLSQKNKESKERVFSYRKALILFFAERKELYSSLTSHDFEQWLMDYRKGRKEETVNHFISVLRSFYLFCVEKGYIAHSPIPEFVVEYWKLRIRLANEENQKVINEYLVSLKNSNRSKIAIISIREHLQILFKDREDVFSSYTTQESKEWIKENQKGWKEKTLSNYLYHLRAFYHFCVKEGYMEKNPILYQREKEQKYWEVQIPLPNKENEERINEYLLTLFVANYSELTVKGYRSTLQNFFKKRKQAYSSIASEEIHQWLTQLQEKCNEGTSKYRLSVLNSFYKYCVDEGYIGKSPIKRRWFPRLPQPVPKFLNKEEVAKVRKESEMEIHRNRVLVEFLLTSGCRIGEVKSLNRSDVDIENRTALVKGKGQKIRQVHFSVKCALLLERYLEIRKDQNPALFVTSHINPRRLSSKRMSTIINRIGNRAQLLSSLHPHRLRHTFATDLLEKGAELSFIADALGHARLSTTQIYANLPKQKIITLYRKYMG